MGVDEATLDHLAVVVVNYGTSHLLRQTLQAVHREIPEASVYVVDNFSTPEERDAVGTLSQQMGWHLVTPHGNVGFGGGCNEGARAAIADGATTLLFLNPDAHIDRASVLLLSERVRDGSRVIVAPTIFRPDGSVWFDGNELNLADGSVRSRRTTARQSAEHGFSPWLSGACFLLRAEFWTELGGFDDSFFLYWEDIDLSYRAVRSGGQLVVEAGATAQHDEGGSQARATQASSLSPLYYRYNIRNRLLFAAKHLDDDALRRWRRRSVQAAWRIVRRGRGRRELLTSPGAIMGGLRATLEGLRLTRTPRLDRPIRVMLSFPSPRPTSNPYNVMMKNSLESLDDVAVQYFSWRAAIFDRVDVFHVHWPESAMVASTPVRSAGKHVCFVLMVIAMRLRRTAWVRTVHNLDLPQDISWVTRQILKWADGGTTLRILINPFTPIPPGEPHATILHGHYVDWFEEYPRQAKVPGRIAYVGTIRRYKGVPRLIEAFREIEDDQLTLTVAGRLSHDAYAETLTSLASEDPRVRLRLGFLSDADLVTDVTRSELVVLPYPEMHNSGMALCVLSLQRPILVPDNGINRSLAKEVGAGWVHFFTGELSPDDLHRAVRALADDPPSGSPDLGDRSWAISAQRHAAAYLRAVHLARGYRDVPPQDLLVDRRSAEKALVTDR